MRDPHKERETEREKVKMKLIVIFPANKTATVFPALL